LRKSRYTGEPIIQAPQQREAGRTTAEICRKPGVSEQTFYPWKAKFGGMNVADAKRLKGLKDEDGREKQRLGFRIPPDPGESACMRSAGSPQPPVDSPPRSD